MSSELSTMLRERLTRVRRAVAAAGLDALLVSHLPNIRYLTGFSGSAGSLIVTASQAVLVVDFRYSTAAAALADDGPEGWLRVLVAETTEVDRVAATIRALECRRIGIEAASMAVSQFNRLSAALAGNAVPQRAA